MLETSTDKQFVYLRFIADDLKWDWLFDKCFDRLIGYAGKWVLELREGKLGMTLIWKTINSN